MKDIASAMANDMPPPPFKLERELTLMPNEFRERLSASTRSRKSSAARSAANRARMGRHSASRVTKPLSGQSNSRYTYNNDYDFSLRHNNDYNEVFHGNTNELISSSSYIDASNHMTSIGEHEHILQEMERAYSIKTPPTNMLIHDLMEPLEDWPGGDTIKEKKYTVLPSINKPTPSPTKSDVTLSSLTSTQYSVGNQLDYGRDRMEQEADFFADYRINSSVIHATPRQNPLPPIPIESKKSQTECPHTRQVSAGKSSYNNYNSLGLPVDSLNARQMSGRHKKKNFKYV